MSLSKAMKNALRRRNPAVLDITSDPKSINLLSDSGFQIEYESDGSLVQVPIEKHLHHGLGVSIYLGSDGMVYSFSDPSMDYARYLISQFAEVYPIKYLAPFEYLDEVYDLEDEAYDLLRVPFIFVNAKDDFISRPIVEIQNLFEEADWQMEDPLSFQGIVLHFGGDQGFMDYASTILDPMQMEIAQELLAFHHFAESQGYEIWWDLHRGNVGRDAEGNFLIFDPAIGD